jgi:uncharacterized protein YjiS (DUF1127 family)
LININLPYCDHQNRRKRLITRRKSIFREGDALSHMEDIMRDYALHQAQTAGSLPGAGLLENLLRNWAARRAVRRMESLDDHLLRDIGVTRDEVRWAAGLPLSQNAALSLDERSRLGISKHAV